MKYINPIDTQAWLSLEKHFEKIKNVHLKEFFHIDKNRFKNFSINFNDQIIVDFSKNRINKTTINKLLQLANEMELQSAINDMFNGIKINHTENQPVLHVALRNQSNYPIVVNGNNIMLSINKVLKKMQYFSESVINGTWTGCTNKKITDIVNIGIGGSDLGPHMVIDALTPYKNHLTIHYISNIDGSNLSSILKKINPETVLFIVSSKTFSTQETIMNAKGAYSWLLKKLKNKNCIVKHFCAATANVKEALLFGIHRNNIFEFWNWVGGRYSLWSSVGLSIILAIGFKNFITFLKGAHEMDQHFLKTEFKKNIPVLLGMISIWYNNFYKMETEAILPYDEYMHRLPEFLQQSNMESNGKNISRNGEQVTWQTGPIIWGKSGTNGQHSFYQLMHQGTKIIPCDFIAPINSHHQFKNHHKILLSNFFAQTKALAFGKREQRLSNVNSKEDKLKNNISFFKCFAGNRPSNSILLKQITPYTLGSLIALYEHKIFTQGIIFNIFSFDQWGVELGKHLSNSILEKINDCKVSFKYDSSTENLLKYYRIWKK